MLLPLSENWVEYSKNMAIIDKKKKIFDSDSCRFGSLKKTLTQLDNIETEDEPAEETNEFNWSK